MKTIRLRSFSCAAFIITAAAIVACSGSDNSPSVGSAETNSPTKNNPPATPVVVTATVGTQGGTLVNSDGSGVSIPPGALPDNVTVSVTPTPDAPPPTGAEPLGLPTTFGPAGLKFEKPVTVYLAFDPSKLPPGTDVSRIVVMTAPDGTTNYEPLPTSLKDATHVAAETTHFSVLIPVIPPPTVDAGTPTPDACTPATCQSLGAGVCGKQDDGCGGSLDCGACPDLDAGAGNDSGTTSGGDAGSAGDDAGTSTPDAGNIGVDSGSSGGMDASAPMDDAGQTTGGDSGTTMPDAGIVDASTDAGCIPRMCGNYGPGACGALPDGCGTMLDCGVCLGGNDAGMTGGDGGTGGTPDASLPDGGTCMALTCANYGSCGSFPDGCGGMLSCGCGDAGPSTDGGAVCIPNIINCPQGSCGPVPNGCGGYLNCGVCSGGDAGIPMADGGAPALDGGTCNMQTCSPQMCGVYPNGCGGQMQCMGGCSMDGSTCKPAMCPPSACGSYPDGCGGMMQCMSGCDGGGMVDASIDSGPCVMQTCGGKCGIQPNGCGGPMDCGPCGDGGTSGGDASACLPMKCSPSACGVYPDGCGGMMQCSMGCDGGAMMDAAPPPPPPDGGCMPMQCKPGSCGPMPDGCGNVMNCGPCDAAAGGDASSCVPMSCAGYGPQACGTYPNGCGGMVQCTMGCTGDAGADSGFNCKPMMCQPGMCGLQPDGCGGTTNCGPCDASVSCTPKTCGQLGIQCGPAPDGCGGMLNCGACPDSGVSCTPKTCADYPGKCGVLDNGCGTPIDCPCVP